METKDILKIYGIKTNDGYLISTNPNESYNRYGYNELRNHIVNGEELEKTFNKHWLKSDREPLKIEVKVNQPNINHRYELIDKNLESKDYPLILDRDEVYDSDDGCWKSEYAHKQSLYKLKYDKQESKIVEVDFEYIQLAEVEEVKNPDSCNYEVQRLNTLGSSPYVLTGNNARHQLLDEIMFPPVMLGNKPSKFTSKQMYKIVRQYIKENIDLKYAQITSDYDFCFTVKKIIPIDPYEIKNEIMKSNGRPYKKPRFNKRYVKNRSKVVFEMTHSEENYKGYTPIPEMIGEDIEDLKQKVDRYCEDLIEEINKPYHDCHMCNGSGVILDKDINTQQGEV